MPPVTPEPEFESESESESEFRASAAPAAAPCPIAPARVRVRFGDTDAAGIVYYGNYLRFFEAARVEALRSAGVSYADLVAGGLQTVVVEASVRYRRPAVFDDLLLVHARVTDVGRAQFRFAYEVRREGDDALIATGETLQAFLDGATLRPVRAPALALEVLGRLRR